MRSRALADIGFSGGNTKFSFHFIIFLYVSTDRNSQTNIQTDGQTDTQTDRRTYRRTDKHTDRQTHIQTDRQTNKQRTSSDQQSDSQVTHNTTPCGDSEQNGGHPINQSHNEMRDQMVGCLVERLTYQHLVHDDS